MTTRKIKNSNITPATLTSASLNDTGVTAGSYGSASQVPVLTINAKGQITLASTTSVAGVSTFTYTSGTRTLNISTADGGSFNAALSNLATETYVNTAVSNLVNAAPSTLDTLNELAAALGNDANYATTITTSLGTKVDKINITSGSVGSATQIPVITYNAQGQITAVSTAALNASSTNTANYLVQRDSSGNFSAGTISSTRLNSTSVYSDSYYSTSGNTVINSNGDITFDGTPTTTNQNRGLFWTAYDKEGTADFSDVAHIRHTTNSGGLDGSVLEIKSFNDANDGVNFLTGSNSGVRINGNTIWNSGNQTTSFGGNGYITLPNGLILQWCVGAGISSESDTTTSFPITFPNACLFVTVGTQAPNGDRDSMFQMRSYNTSSVTSRCNAFNSAGGTLYPTVFAIGY